MTPSDKLDNALLHAHRINDVELLEQLYTNAADAEEHKHNVDAACFYLTHAFVYALQAGLEQHVILRARLQAHGRL